MHRFDRDFFVVVLYTSVKFYHSLVGIQKKMFASPTELGLGLWSDLWLGSEL